MCDCAKQVLNKVLGQLMITKCPVDHAAIIFLRAMDATRDFYTPICQD